MSFDTLINRRNTNSSKWNIKENEIAMGLADMDFQCAPAIREAINKINNFGVFGYSDIDPKYYEAYQTWWKKRHNFTMNTDWMIFSTGIVPAISSIVRKLTTPAENVLIQAPVYNIFYNSIRNNGRNILSSDLIYKDGKYDINWINLEAKLEDPQTSMMILCNPHNPVGKIWDKKTLEKIGELCKKNNVTVVSDEIHCDIVQDDKGYIPFASVNETCANISVTCLSASKAFNMAGLQAACVVVPNKNLRHKVWRGLNTDEVAEPNVFATNATIAAFNESEDWLNQLNRYIQTNKEIASNYIKENIPMIHVVDSKATYLLWIDCRNLKDSKHLCDHLIEKTGLHVSDGAIFGKAGEGFIRINMACPKDRMMDGLTRLKKGIESL